MSESTTSGPSTVCTRHPNRPTGLACSRCRRPMCPECLREAPVGMQCTDCITDGARTTRTPRGTGGAPVRAAGGTPVVVVVLVVLNLLVFVVTAASAGSVQGNASSPLFDAWALVPHDVAQGEWYRLLTSGFLHIGPLHIAFNMIALWIIGRDVEMVLGRLRFALVYLVSLLGGSTAVMLFGPAMGATAGASGAVFGLMGGLAILARRLRVSMTPVLVTIAINIVISFVIPGISVLGHLGGLVTGVVVTAGLLYGPGRSRPPVGVGLAGLVAAVLVVLVGVRVATLAALGF